ncbi:hypothetical protein IMG5_023840 [Ichthyophthirius multifiliis]|uniref:Uncharacterized protein n=1 Tax=Ichthyophthirius multifiliis TaxID=5932 RepID=G0QL02_ICHMU|nr:hypothetical protein IMG5_023840 [Ichthyophthirius multifiliis]EGR34106.1 hypothetical protein IMG5_023840 [Ichthyophthirius multifiliis]|eukprot:XP_004039410.1 hypothetical protein IMG5_023840 [Ichthyophthirius multifiliis]
MPSKQQVQLEARKEHARELRKAHFHLGFEKGIQKETESQYQEDYKAYNLEAAQKTKDEMQKLQKDLRSNHYILGTDNDASKIFISTAAQSFQQPKNPQISQLSLETKNDLRSHHFNLGYSKDPEISDYKINYDPKQINLDVLKDKKEQINMLRKHNHDFGDNKDYYSSIYNENFSKTYDPQYLKQGKSKQEILEQIIELRKTNLSMGNNNPQYTSEAMAEFNVKPSACRALMDQNLKKLISFQGMIRIYFILYLKIILKENNFLSTILIKQKLCQKIQDLHILHLETIQEPFFQKLIEILFNLEKMS